MTYNKEDIQAKLKSSDKWLIRGLLAIYNNQTSHEKVVEGVVEDNGIGFNGVDGEILTKMAKWYNDKGWLSPKQIALVRRKMLKYAGQLAKIANEKQGVPTTETPPREIEPVRAGESRWREEGEQLPSPPEEIEWPNDSDGNPKVKRMYGLENHAI
jgi:hypothetical protein